MDYRALAELVMMSFFGLSAFTLAVGISVRLFLAPTLRDIFGSRGREEAERRVMDGRMRQLEERLDSIEGALDRIADARDFDRQLGGSTPDVSLPSGPRLERPGNG
jgi:hypothetical protein